MRIPIAELVLLFLFAWLIIVVPSQYLSPLLVSNRLSRKNAELDRLLKGLSFIEFTQRRELVESLLEEYENLRYLKANYFASYCFYRLSKNSWIFVLIVAFQATELFQNTETIGF